MKNVKILLVVLLAGLFVTGYVLTQEETSKSPSSCSGKKAQSCTKSQSCTASTKGSCPVTGVSGECPAETTKMSPALAQYVASKRGKFTESCCGTCGGTCTTLAKVAFAAKAPASCQSGCDESACSSTACDKSACSSAECTVASKTKCPAIKKLLKKDISMNFQGKRVYFNSFDAFELFRTAHAESEGGKDKEGVRFVSADVRGSASSPCPVTALDNENLTVIMDRGNVFFIHNGEAKAAEKTVEITETAPVPAKAAEKSSCCGVCGGTCSK